MVSYSFWYSSASCYIYPKHKNARVQLVPGQRSRAVAQKLSKNVFSQSEFTFATTPYTAASAPQFARNACVVSALSSSPVDNSFLLCRNAQSGCRDRAAGVTVWICRMDASAHVHGAPQTCCIHLNKAGEQQQWKKLINDFTSSSTTLIHKVNIAIGFSSPTVILPILFKYFHLTSNMQRF